MVLAMWLSSLIMCIIHPKDNRLCFNMTTLAYDGREMIGEAFISVCELLLLPTVAGLCETPLRYSSANNCPFKIWIDHGQIGRHCRLPFRTYGATVHFWHLMYLKVPLCGCSYQGKRKKCMLLY